MPVLDRLPRLAELAVKGARRAGSAGASAARDLAGGVRRRLQAQERASTTPSATPEEPTAATASEAPPAAAEGARVAPEPAIRPAAGRPAADHVDREAVVVAESHDPGAEAGVGAQITVDEPWDGYDELSAAQVVAEIEGASAGALAVVRLYEQRHRGDAGVLETIDRRLAALEE